MTEEKRAKGSQVLRRDGLGRVRIPKARREALLDEYEKSGLMGAEFAQMAGVKYQTFASWIQQRRHQRGEYLRGKRANQPASLRLVEAVVAEAPSAATPLFSIPPSALRIQLAGGTSLLVADSHQVALAAQLLQALQSSNPKRPC